MAGTRDTRFTVHLFDPRAKGKRTTLCGKTQTTVHLVIVALDAWRQCSCPECLNEYIERYPEPR